MSVQVTLGKEKGRQFTPHENAGAAGYVTTWSRGPVSTYVIMGAEEKIKAWAPYYKAIQNFNMRTTAHCTKHQGPCSYVDCRPLDHWEGVSLRVLQSSGRITATGTHPPICQPLKH